VDKPLSAADVNASKNSLGPTSYFAERNAKYSLADTLFRIGVTSPL
jgi:hypothetical protein